MLPPGEVILIRTLVQIFSQADTFGWVFAHEGPYDALIIDSALSTANGSDAAPQAKAILKLISRDTAPSPHTLQRPIKAEKLQEWLKTAEVDLPTNQTIAVAQQSPGLQAMPETRFRLLRWPPTALLQNDATLIRMSSLLSRRALQLSELAELSNQSVDSCRLFIEKLLPMKLVSCESTAPTVTLSYTTLRPEQQTSTPAKIPFHRGLISGIRRRLGL
ncbi:hypothetical protein BH10PSE16_BH10PSE16_27920 [soil metagenome]